MNDQQISDPQAEVALLAACMHSKTARQEARRHITSADFFQPSNGTIWDAMGALDRAGREVDPITVLAAVKGERGIEQHMVDVTTANGFPDAAGDYAEIIRGWATRRRIQDAGRQLVQRATDTSQSPATLASTAVRVLTTIRDTGAAADVSALTLGELMEGPEDQPKWVIPDLMEAEDRLMLTGSEGAGKSSLSRQLGIMAAAGIHPFNESMIPPIRAAYVDCENKPRQVRRQVAPLLRWLHDNSTTGVDPMSRVMMDFPGRIDLTRDRDLAAIHRMLDACQPDLLVVGPVYKMSNKSLNDEENAAQFLVALDTIMERGVALIIEAHAGHSTEGVDRKTARRNLRPRGSSSLLGWPEFGLGLRALPRGLADLEPWRGGREQRAWPCRLRRAAGNRWVETSPDDPGRLEPDPPSPFDDIPPDPQGAFL